MENKNKSNKYTDTVFLALGEIAVAVLTSVGFALFGKLHWTVITGALLGGAVTVLNFFILTLAVDKAIKKYIDVRGGGEMSEEEAQAFTNAHAMEVQNAMTKSYILRTALMLGTLVPALITGYFDPLATVIPLVMYKPLIYASEFIKRKRGV